MNNYKKNTNAFINLSKIILNVFLVVSIIPNIVPASNPGVGFPPVLLREKRQLLFPNSTLLQFNAGIGVPVPLKDRTIAVNWAFQANFQLPWNRTQIPTDILLTGRGYIEQARSFHHRKRRQHDILNELIDKYKYDNVHKHSKAYSDINKKQKQTQDKYEDKNRKEALHNKYYETYKDSILDKVNLEYEGNYEMRYEDEVRLHHVYEYFEDIISGHGYNGTSCVLRAICQLAAEPIYSDDDEDLLHELSEYLFNPLSDAPWRPDHKENAMPYVKAHHLGLSGADCTQTYSDCKISIVDKITKVHE